MADDVTAPQADSEPVFTPAIPADTGAIDARSAARAITEQRLKALQPPTDKPATRAPDGKFAATPAPEASLEGDDAARPQDATGETQEADPAETPPLELPRSWSKDKADHWAKLDRDVQEYLIEHDKTTSSDVRRSQNEAAEIRKAAEAERQAATQARQQYESAAQNALNVLNAQIASEFADIKTHEDVVKMASEDPFRAIQYKARQDQLNDLHREVQANDQRRVQSEQEQFKTWSKEQDDKFSKRFPEFNDPEKGPKVRASVTSYLTKEIGVPEDVLPRLWNNPLFRDEMFQRVIYEASRFHAAQQAAKSAVPATKPQVQRPGVAPQRGQQSQDEIAGLRTRLTSAKGTESARIAAEIIAAKRRAATRR